MSLNWDITKCTRIPREEPTEDHPLGVVTDEFWPILNSAIWGMLTTGIGWKLTDENAGKFFARYTVAARIGGFDPISREDVHKLVGLATNTSPETDAAWRKRIFDGEINRLQANYNRFVAEANAAKAEGEE